MTKRALLLPVCIIAGLALFSFASSSRSQPPAATPAQYISGITPSVVAAQAYLLPVVDPGYSAIRDTNVIEPVVDANAAALYDVDTGQYLFQKNPDVQVPIASLTKVLSALVVRDLFNTQEIVTVASTSVRVDGQSQTLYTGERITVADLVRMMLVESSNDAAYALAGHAGEQDIDFVARMNAKAAELDMAQCHFMDPAGLDDAAYCTARDLVRLVRTTLRQAPDIWPITIQQQAQVTSVDGAIIHEVKNTNELLGTREGIIGGKTGNTDGALGCLILIVKIPGKDDTLISIVLGSRSRFGDTTSLLDWVGQAWRFQ